MKFGKLLLRTVSLSAAAWAQGWMDYKLLKKLLGAIVEELAAQGSGSANEEPPDGGSSARFRSTLQGNELADKLEASPAETAFFQKLHEDLQRVSSLYDELEDKFVSSYAQLLRSVREFVVEWGNSNGPAAAATVPGGSGAATGPAPPPVVGPSSAAAAASPGVEAPGGGGGGSGERGLRLMSTVVKFYMSLIQLENFAVINYCGFGKILKKHDKLTGVSTKSVFMGGPVEQQRFAHYRRLLRVLQGTEQAYQLLSSLRPGEEAAAMDVEDAAKLANLREVKQGLQLQRAKETDNGAAAAAAGGGQQQHPSSSAASGASAWALRRPSGDGGDSRSAPPAQAAAAAAMAMAVQAVHGQQYQRQTHGPQQHFQTQQQLTQQQLGQQQFQPPLHFQQQQHLQQQQQQQQFQRQQQELMQQQFPQRQQQPQLQHPLQFQQQQLLLKQQFQQRQQLQQQQQPIGGAPAFPQIRLQAPPEPRGGAGWQLSLGETQAYGAAGAGYPGVGSGGGVGIDQAAKRPRMTPQEGATAAASASVSASAAASASVSASVSASAASQAGAGSAFSAAERKLPRTHSELLMASLQEQLSHAPQERGGNDEGNEEAGGESAGIDAQGGGDLGLSGVIGGGVGVLHAGGAPSGGPSPGFR